MQNRVIHTRLLCTLFPSLKVRQRRSEYLFHRLPQVPFDISNQRPLFKPCRHPRSWSFQIYVLNPRFPLTRLTYQVPKILSRDLALPLDLNPLFPLLPQLLYRLLQAGAQAFGRVAEDFADFGGNAGGVGMGVVEGREGCGDAAGEAGC